MTTCSAISLLRNHILFGAYLLIFFPLQHLCRSLMLANKLVESACDSTFFRIEKNKINKVFLALRCFCILVNMLDCIVYYFCCLLSLLITRLNIVLIGTKLQVLSKHSFAVYFKKRPGEETPSFLEVCITSKQFNFVTTIYFKKTRKTYHNKK